MVTIIDNRVFIDNAAIKEPFKTKPCVGDDGPFPCANFGPFKVPDNEYFLLADNRGESEDSRLWSPHTITRDQIVGKVIRVVRSRRAT